MMQGISNPMLAEGWLTPATGLAGLILLAGLLLGFKDIVRFSLTRALAIASVCFTQSRRRGVFFITPLVILGVIVVSQFQKADDAQDAIRQTTNACLFAAGLLVTVVIIMVACTNIPREIENRVIYTVTTKPVTRLEIVLGKVMGFSAVSFWILVIMGVFALAYLNWLDHRARHIIHVQLEANEIPRTSRVTAEYYDRHGTLHSRVFGIPQRLTFLATEPRGPDDWWIPADPKSGGEGSIVVPFLVDESKIPPPVQAPLGPGLEAKAYAGGLWVKAVIRARRIVPATRPTTQPADLPRVAIDLHWADGRRAVGWDAASKIDAEGRREGWTALSDYPTDIRDRPDARGVLVDYVVYVSPDNLKRWLAPDEKNDVRVAITGINKDYEYALVQQAMRLESHDNSLKLSPSGPVQYVGPIGNYGQRLRGQRGGIRRIALYEFRNAPVPAGQNTHPFELRVFTEMDREDYSAEDEATEVGLTFRNRKTGQATQEIRVYPENNRPLYFDVPAAGVAGGDFDVVLRCTSPNFVTLRSGIGASLRLVAADQSFALNLLESLTVLWLMSLLVVIVAVSCSTFVSWPVAIVLTLVILSARWCVQELGDMAQPGVGGRVATDLFRGSSAEVTVVVSKSVDALARLISAVAPLLPDLSQFSAMEEMNRGAAVSLGTLLGAIKVTFCYGIPILVMGWLFLRYKEVAP
ncbi:MAG: ABC transporter permease [Tepidisphaerales bacterium]